MPIPFRCRFRLNLLLIAGYLAAPADSAAVAPLSVGLEYSAPSECPSTAQVVELFQQWSPSVKMVTADPKSGAIRLQVTLTDQGFAGTLESASLGGMPEKREALATACRETVETLVFAAALFFDPIVGYQRTAPSPVQVTVVRPATKPVAETTRVAVAPWRMGSGLNSGAGLALGSAAGVSFFVERMVGRLVSPPSLRLRLLFWNGSSAPKSEPSVNLEGSSGETTGCWPIWRTSAVRISPCGGFQLGTLVAEGVGVPTPQRNTRVWAAAVAEARVEAWPWRSFGFEAHIGATLSITNYRFVVVKGADAVAVHTASGWAPQVGAGFIWKFP